MKYLSENLSLKSFLLQKFSIINGNFGFLFLCLTIFLLPFPRALPLWSMGIFLFFGITYWFHDYKNIFKKFREDIFLIAGTVSYFLIHFIWALIQKVPFSYYSNSIVFVLVPLFGYPVFILPLTSRNFNIILKAFILGLFLIGIYEIFQALIDSISIDDNKILFNPNIGSKFLEDGRENPFYSSRFMYSYLSFIENPIYLSMKVLLALVLIVEYKAELKLTNILFYGLLGFFLIYFFLLSSRASILTLIILIIIKYCSVLYKRKARLIWILFLPFIFFLVYKLSMSNFIIKTKTNILINEIELHKNELVKADRRLRAWITSWELIKQNPIFGTGLKSRDLLEDEYRKQGYTEPFDLKLNPHNQFLEVQLAFGIPGTLIFFYILIAPFILRRKSIDISLYTTFMIIIFISILFASLITGVWGALFFILFYNIIVLRKENHKESYYGMMQKNL